MTKKGNHQPNYRRPSISIPSSRQSFYARMNTGFLLLLLIISGVAIRGAGDTTPITFSLSAHLQYINSLPSNQICRHRRLPSSYISSTTSTIVCRQVWLVGSLLCRQLWLQGSLPCRQIRRFILSKTSPC